MTNKEGVPEIYADFAQIATGNLGVFLGFRSIAPLLVEPGEEIPSELKAIVRLSPGQAKAFAIMLRTSLKNYEREQGVIPLPVGVLEGHSEIDEW